MQRQGSPKTSGTVNQPDKDTSSSGIQITTARNPNISKLCKEITEDHNGQRRSNGTRSGSKENDSKGTTVTQRGFMAEMKLGYEPIAAHI